MKANLIICRQEGNRLTAISGGATASVVYDADGNRVKSTVGGVTTVYIAGVFEFIENGATDKMTTYYDGNAMRRSGYGIDDGVFYLLQDHLKSSSSFVNQSGAPWANNNYYPYGGNRSGAFSNLTTKRFTGQYHESSLPGGEGLSYYNARWYDAKLGRFLSADTIVPGPANPQAFNRYSYVFNNPLRFTDPSGHDPCDNGGKCYGEPPRGGNPYSPIRYPRSQGVPITLGAKPYPAVSPLYFYGFELPFGNGGTSGIFGDGKQYSSLHAKWEGDFIVTCWFTESCGARVFFGPYSALTQDIRTEPGVQKLREAWAAQNYGLPFRQGVSQEVRDSSMAQDARMINGAFVLLRENWQMIANMFSLGSTTPEGTLDPVGGVVGGYTINLYDAGDGLVLFEAVNVTSLGSGSRIPGTSRTYIQSRPQSEPGPGGNFTQIFYWWERMPQ